MELFLLGVGNYTEADVEAATAAWTGHTDNWETDVYVWRADWHDAAPKTVSRGRRSTLGADQNQHGSETIDVVLGNGVVPAGASIACEPRAPDPGGRRRVHLQEALVRVRRYIAACRRDRRP